MRLFLSALHNGLREVWCHKLRSLLTIVCVQLGVASLLVTVGFMEGRFAGWEASINERGGLEKITTRPARELPRHQEPFAILAPGLTLADATALREALPELPALSPELDLDARLTLGDKHHRVRVQGVTEDIFTINRYAIASGRGFTDLDHHDRAPVIILGTAPARALFSENEDPVGRYVTLNGAPFLVIGVLQHYERLYGTWNLLRRKNEIAFVPLPTMAHTLARTDRLSWLNFKAPDLENLQTTVDAARNLLLQRHRGIADFELETNEAELASYTTEKAGYVSAALAIGGVSLLVSGIGILNLMLASINERVREIGIRKAIGATPFNIFIQFLVEAVLLSLLGGAVGIAVAAGAIALLEGWLPPGSAPVFAGYVAAIGFAFSVTAGVAAGIYPALRAARLDPIEALRYE